MRPGGRKNQRLALATRIFGKAGRVAEGGKTNFVEKSGSKDKQSRNISRVTEKVEKRKHGRVIREKKRGEKINYL